MGSNEQCKSFTRGQHTSSRWLKPMQTRTLPCRLTVRMETYRSAEGSGAHKAVAPTTTAACHDAENTIGEIAERSSNVAKEDYHKFGGLRSVERRGCCSFSEWQGHCTNGYCSCDTRRNLRTNSTKKGPSSQASSRSGSWFHRR